MENQIIFKRNKKKLVQICEINERNCLINNLACLHHSFKNVQTNFSPIVNNYREKFIENGFVITPLKITTIENMIKIRNIISQNVVDFEFQKWTGINGGSGRKQTPEPQNELFNIPFIQKWPKFLNKKIFKFKKNITKTENKILNNLMFDILKDIQDIVDQLFPYTTKIIVKKPSILACGGDDQELHRDMEDKTLIELENNEKLLLSIILPLEMDTELNVCPESHTIFKGTKKLLESEKINIPIGTVVLFHSNLFHSGAYAGQNVMDKQLNDKFRIHFFVKFEQTIGDVLNMLKINDQAYYSLQYLKNLIELKHKKRQKIFSKIHYEKQKKIK